MMKSMPICYLQPNYAKKTRNYLYNPENENRKARDGCQNYFLIIIFSVLANLSIVKCLLISHQFASLRKNEGELLIVTFRHQQRETFKSCSDF